MKTLKYLLLCPFSFFLFSEETEPYVLSYEEGGIEIQGQFLDDLQVGTWKAFYKNGSLKGLPGTDL